MTTEHFDLSGFRPWFLPGRDEPIGYMPERVAEDLRAETLLQTVNSRLTLPVDGSIDTALEALRVALAAAGLIPPRRDEFMPVRTGPFSAPLAVIDRSAMRMLGLWATKIHANGLVRMVGEDRPSIWLSKRSPVSTAAPLSFDTMIAGGQPAGMTREETLAKEAEEEVGVPRMMSAAAVWIKDLQVHYKSELGLHREVLAIYDLDIPHDFEPDHRDGEIVESILLTGPQFAEATSGRLDLKHSSKLVCEDLARRLDN